MSRTAWWTIGIIVVLIIIGLVWWGVSSSNSAMQASSEQTATTTAATSTAQTTAANDRSSDTVASVLASLGNSQFSSLLSASGVSLSGTGPYTVFVSTDAGYNLLPAGTIANMTAAQQKRMVEYSIVSGKALDINAVNDGDVTTMSGDTLNFHVGSTGLVQANSSYALAEYKASNGIVYVINQPLLPPTASTQ